MAKIGGLNAFSNLSRRDGPSFVATPYCSYTASQLGLQGVLAALDEREASGVGQRVDTTLVQGALAHDTWNWIVRLLTSQYPGVLSAAPPVDSERLIPNHALFFRLLVGLSADGRWMQFSQTSERLWQAFLDGHRARRRARRARVPRRAELRGSRDPGRVLGGRPHQHEDEDLRRVARGLRRASRRVGRPVPPRHRAPAPPAARPGRARRHPRRSRARQGAPARAARAHGRHPRAARPTGAAPRRARRRDP